MGGFFGKHVAEGLFPTSIIKNKNNIYIFYLEKTNKKTNKLIR